MKTISLMNEQQPNAEASPPEANPSFSELKREVVAHAVAGWKRLDCALGKLETLLAHNGLAVDPAEALKSPEVLKCVLTLVVDHSISESDLRKWYEHKYDTQAARLFLKRAPFFVTTPQYREVTEAFKRNVDVIRNMRRMLTSMRQVEAEIQPLALSLSQELLEAGLTDFGEYMDTMVCLFGTGIKPYLPDYYETLAMKPQNQALDLTEPDAVEGISELPVLTTAQIQSELVANAVEAWDQLCSPREQLNQLLCYTGVPGTASELLESPEKFKEVLAIIAAQSLSEAAMREWYYRQPITDDWDWASEAVQIFADLAPLY